MPRIAYERRRFNGTSALMIEQADQIISEYNLQGFNLTLRQLYYQFVARDLIENSQRSYKRLGSLVNNARLAGYIDWDAITDRTRNLQQRTRWGSPVDIVDAAASSYHIDMWEEQPIRPEVWIEKDALIGVISGVCDRLDVPYFSCRGYTSQSEMWGAAQRHLNYIKDGQHTVVIHLGDHDPSGIDMTRDIQDRMDLFMGAYSFQALPVNRIALNEDQVAQYNPPPNPAKLSDTRAQGYIMRFGYESWELDALEPSVLSQLIEDTVIALQDGDLWRESEERLEREREILTAISEDWEIIEDMFGS